MHMPAEHYMLNMHVIVRSVLQKLHFHTEKRPSYERKKGVIVL